MTKSKIFLYFCLSFVIGVFIESLIKIPLSALGGFFISGISLITIFWSKNKKAVVAGLCLLLFAFGGLRFLQKETSGSLSQLNDKGRVTIIGAIRDLPVATPNSQKFVAEARQVVINGKVYEINGSALVTANPLPLFKYGDLFEISGQLNEPENFQDFDYKNYLAKSDIYSLMDYPEIKILAPGKSSKIKASLFWLKGKFEETIKKLLPEPEAGFLAGLTLGESKNLPDDLSLAFQKTGTSHIVALSGYNITIIASFIMTIFGWFMLRKNLRFWLATLAILFFTILTGAASSVVRASIMGFLVLLAANQGRLFSVRNALVFAGGFMIFLNPKILRFDIGFQLSFLATAGLIWISPVFEKLFDKLPKIFGLKGILIATLSAQLAVLPLILINFSRLSIIAPLANLAILIFIPSTMLFGFLAGTIGMLWLAAAKIFSWLAWLFLWLELGLIKFFAGLPFSSFQTKWGWPMAIIYYLILIGLLYLFYNKEKKEILVEQWADK